MIVFSSEYTIQDRNTILFDLDGTLVETDYANAIKYLRGETLTPERQYQRGYVLVTYRGVPLGFANNVGTRLNNAYPQAWRIRSTYAPDSPPVLDL